MAIIKNADCDVCGKPFTGIVGQNSCSRCLKKKNIEDKVEWLADRRYNEDEERERTIEERIAWIEEWIYEHKELATTKLIKDNITF